MIVAAVRSIDPTITAAVIMATASVVGTLVGGWYTFRAARKNTQETKKIEAEKLSTSSWESQVDSWRADVVTLRQQRSEDLAIYESYKRESSQQITELNERLDKVMELREKDRREHRLERETLENRIDALTDWGRQAVRIMEQQGISFPSPPPGMMPDDPNGRPQRSNIED